MMPVDNQSQAAATPRRSMLASPGVGKLSPMTWAWLTEHAALLVGFIAAAIAIVQFVWPGVCKLTRVCAGMLAAKPAADALPVPGWPDPRLSCRECSEEVGKDDL